MYSCNPILTARNQRKVLFPHASRRGSTVVYYLGSITVVFQYCISCNAPPTYGFVTALVTSTTAVTADYVQYRVQYLAVSRSTEATAELYTLGAWVRGWADGSP